MSGEMKTKTFWMVISPYGTTYLSSASEWSKQLCINRWVEQNRMFGRKTWKQWYGSGFRARQFKVSVMN